MDRAPKSSLTASRYIIKGKLTEKGRGRGRGVKGGMPYTQKPLNYIKEKIVKMNIGILIKQEEGNQNAIHEVSYPKCKEKIYRLWQSNIVV